MTTSIQAYHHGGVEPSVSTVSTWSAAVEQPLSYYCGGVVQVGGTGVHGAQWRLCCVKAQH